MPKSSANDKDETNETGQVTPVKKRKICSVESQTNNKRVKAYSLSSSDSSEEEEVAKKLQKLQQSSFTSVETVQNSKCSTNEGWRTIEKQMLVYESSGLKHSSKISAFDMDGTIITTKSGKTFMQNVDDWKLWDRKVKDKLNELHDKGHKIVFITNQLGIGKGKVSESDFKTKVEAVVNKIGIPVQVLALIKKGEFRKPNIGTYEWLQTDGNGGIPITKDNFIYVGDAAGRAKGWGPGKKKDFSCSDRLFAINIGCAFHTPEEFFLGHRKIKFEIPCFDPRSLSSKLAENNDSSHLVARSKGEQNHELGSKQLEVIVFVGYPASGKSTFASNYLKNENYVIINQDQLKTKEKCVRACKEALASGKSCVIDNTNPDPVTRKSYIDVAKAADCRCRCFYFEMDIKQVFHNNRFRELSKSSHATVPTMILYSFRKKLVEPNLSEGFSQVQVINFVPNFKDERMRKMYFRFLD